MRLKSRCPVCGRRGWRLALDAGTGLCVACAQEFRLRARAPSQAVMAALNRLHAGGCSEEQRSALTAEIKTQGQKLLEVIKTYRLEPGEALPLVMRHSSPPEEDGPPGPAQGDE
jgi:hypothetical protein